jgi:hypothetical protein
MREQVPIPSERPFDLGYERQPIRTAAQVPAEASAVARRPARRTPVNEPANFEARFGPAMTAPTAPRNTPMSAYAPALAAGAVLTGRGLY